MRIQSLAMVLAAVALCAIVGRSASAHPGSGIAVDPEGQVFFTDTGHGVWKVDASGTLIDLRTPSRFHWLAVDPEGRFADSDRTFGEWFERVTPKGVRPAVIQCSDFPLAFGRDGNIYYADTRPNSARIVRHTADGRRTVLARDRSFEDVQGIVIASDGSVYLTESRGDVSAIRRIKADGTLSTVASGFAGKDPVKDPPHETPAAYCRGLDVDASGVVYVAATGSRRVLKITPQGEVSTILEAPSPWQPTGVALFDGDVYVLEMREPPAAQQEDRPAWIPRVRKIARDGTISTLATVSR